MCCIYVAGLIEAGCLLPPGGVLANFAGSRCVVCCVYCHSMLYHSVFVLGGGGGGVGGGHSFVASVLPDYLLVWGNLAN